VDTPSDTRYLEVRKAILTGVMVGVLGGLFILLVRLVLFFTLPELTRNSAIYKVASYTGWQIAGVLTQCIAAIIVAGSVKYLSVYHAMFAAFVASVMVSILILLPVNWLGGRIDFQLIWMTFSILSNVGSASALLVALLTRGLIQAIHR
jgi:hypothetical protein